MISSTALDLFKCHITLEPFKEPVICDDGCTYEKTAILNHYNQRISKRLPITSPLTNNVLKNIILIDNNIICNLMDELQIQNRYNINTDTCLICLRKLNDICITCDVHFGYLLIDPEFQVRRNICSVSS